MEIKVDNWFLYFSAITANLFFISTGCMFVWSSPVLPKFQSNDTSVNPLGAPITILQLSTLTSMSPIGTTIGTLLLGKLPDLIGRKKTIVYVAMGIIISFVGLSFSNRIYMYYIFLAMLAVTVSAGCIVVPTYIAEIADDHNRGKLGCFVSVGIISGELYGYILGAVTSVKTLFLLCAVPSVVLLTCSIFIPESPMYLSTKGNEKEAILVLKKLRKTKQLYTVEMEHLEKQNMLLNKSSKGQIGFKSLFVNRAVKKGFLLSIAVRVVQQLSGIYIVLSFLGPLLNQTGSSLSGDVIAIIVTCIELLSALVAVIVVEKSGRRFLVLFSTSVCGVSMFILGIYYYFQQNDYVIPPNILLIPIFSVICFVASFSTGLSSVPFILSAELLPNELRSFGTSIAQLAGNVCVISMSFAYPIVADCLGIHYCMFAFSFFSFSGFIFMFLFLPETNGRSFEEIRIILSK